MKNVRHRRPLGTCKLKPQWDALHMHKDGSNKKKDRQLQMLAREWRSQNAHVLLGERLPSAATSERRTLAVSKKSPAETECMAQLLCPGHRAGERKTCLHWKVCAWMLAEARSRGPRKWKQMSFRWGIGNKYVLSAQWDIFHPWRDPNYRQTLRHRGTPKHEAKWEQRLRKVTHCMVPSPQNIQKSQICADGRSPWTGGWGWADCSGTGIRELTGWWTCPKWHDTTLQSHQTSSNWTLSVSGFSGVWIRSEKTC